MGFKVRALLVLLTLLAFASACTYEYKPGSTLTVVQSHEFSVGPITTPVQCKNLVFVYPLTTQLEKPYSSYNIPVYGGAPIEAQKYYVASDGCVYLNLSNSTYVLYPAHYFSGVCGIDKKDAMTIDVKVSPIGGCKACQAVKNLKQADLFVSKDINNHLFYVQGVLEKSVGSREPLDYKPFIVWIHNTTYSRLCRIESDAQGVAKLYYNPNIAMDYSFMYCCYNKSCGLQECLKALGVPSSTLQSISTIKDIDVCKEAVPVNHPLTPSVATFPAVSKVTIAPVEKKNVFALCLPLMFIFSFLLAAMLMVGRNPLSLFDISSLRMRRHITYMPRGMQIGAKLSSRFLYSEAQGVATSMAAEYKKSKAKSLKGFLKKKFSLSGIKNMFKSELKSEENQALGLVKMALGAGAVGMNLLDTIRGKNKMAKMWQAKASAFLGGGAAGPSSQVMNQQGAAALNLGLVGTSSIVTVAANLLKAINAVAGNLGDAFNQLRQGNFSAALASLTTALFNFFSISFFGTSLGQWHNAIAQLCDTYSVASMIRDDLEQGKAITPAVLNAQIDEEAEKNNWSEDEVERKKAIVMQELNGWAAGGKEVAKQMIGSLMAGMGFVVAYKFLCEGEQYTFNSVFQIKIRDKNEEKVLEALKTKGYITLSPHYEVKRINGHSREVVEKGVYDIHVKTPQALVGLITDYFSQYGSKNPNKAEFAVLGKVLGGLFGSEDKAVILSKAALFGEKYQSYVTNQLLKKIESNPQAKKVYDTVIAEKKSNAISLLLKEKGNTTLPWPSVVKKAEETISVGKYGASGDMKKIYDAVSKVLDSNKGKDFNFSAINELSPNLRSRAYSVFAGVLSSSMQQASLEMKSKKPEKPVMKLVANQLANIASPQSFQSAAIDAALPVAEWSQLGNKLPSMNDNVKIPSNLSKDLGGFVKDTNGVSSLPVTFVEPGKQGKAKDYEFVKLKTGQIGVNINPNSPFGKFVRRVGVVSEIPVTSTSSGTVKYQLNIEALDTMQKLLSQTQSNKDPVVRFVTFCATAKHDEYNKFRFENKGFFAKNAADIVSGTNSSTTTKTKDNVPLLKSMQQKVTLDAWSREMRMLNGVVNNYNSLISLYRDEQQKTAMPSSDRLVTQSFDLYYDANHIISSSNDKTFLSLGKLKIPLSTTPPKSQGKSSKSQKKSSKTPTPLVFRVCGTDGRPREYYFVPPTKAIKKKKGE